MLVADVLIDFVWAHPSVTKSDQPDLNRRAEQLIGRVAAARGSHRRRPRQGARRRHAVARRRRRAARRHPRQGHRRPPRRAAGGGGLGGDPTDQGVTSRSSRSVAVDAVTGSNRKLPVEWTTTPAGRRDSRRAAGAGLCRLIDACGARIALRHRIASRPRWRGCQVIPAELVRGNFACRRRPRLIRPLVRRLLRDAKAGSMGVWQTATPDALRTET